MKYFIYCGNGRIGIKYNRKTGVMNIGSYTKFETIIFSILYNICQVEDSSKYRVQSQKNKVRYDIEMDFEKYCKIINKLKEDYTLQETRTLYRIMR